MIPSHWHPRHRPLDGELAGYLAPDPAGPDLFLPLTLLGTPLGDPAPFPQAAAIVDERGLAALNGRWWIDLPDPLPNRTLDLPPPGPGDVPRPVRLVEVGPHTLTLRPEFPAPDERSALVRLPVPPGDRLRAP